jgi:zinc/manganese transport system ATP-binding protein
LGRVGTLTVGPLIEFCNAGAAYGDRWIWRGANLTVERGEFVAVIGPNGAGKSTLLKMTLGAMVPAEGTVLVDGAAPRRGRQPVGYAPQARPVVAGSGIRGSEVVRFGVDGHRWGLPLPGRANAEARERVDAALASVSAAGYASRRIAELSGGELQRLMLAQALVRRPCLLALDEPVANLDVTSRPEFIALVARLARTHNVAVMMVTHDVNGLLPYLDRIVCVARGRIEAGVPDDVITSDALSRLYGAPIEVLRDSKGGRFVSGLAGSR